VIDLIKEKMPVSISLGLWMTLLLLHLDPARHPKAVRDGSRFDVWTSGVIIVGYAMPSFLFAILLIVLFAGGSFLDMVSALRGLSRTTSSELSWWQKILDYFWHMTLPMTAMLLGAFATMTLLTKNSFLDEIRKQYVTTARAKGLTERRVLYGHVFRNAMLMVIAGFPGAFIGAFFTGSLLIETSSRSMGWACSASVGDQPRLSGGVRHALHLLAAGPGRELLSPTSPTPGSIRASISRAGTSDARLANRLSRSGRPRDAAAPALACTLSPINQRRLGELQGEPARLLVAVDLPRSLFVLTLFAPSSSPTTGRSSPPTRARCCSGAGRLPREQVRRLPRRDGLPRPVIADEISANGWMIWPPIRYSYRTVDQH
jgi:hypothetical protein